MERGYANLRELVNTNPLGFLVGYDSKLTRIAENYLPYSTGIEIECGYLGGRSTNIFSHDARNIPDIMDVDCDLNEKRFRIPAGIKGMICLYRICELVKKDCELNMKSGIHYHIDCTDLPFDKFFYDENNERSKWYSHGEWMLKILDNWGYKGTYNSRSVSSSGSNWVRISTEHKTLEFRIGEMSFDYQVLIKRIISCQKITRMFKKQILKN